MDSSLAAKRMPICTPLAPSRITSTISLPVITPPAPITGILTTSRTSGTITRMERSVPKWPPASFPSTITAEAPSISEIRASFALETIGTIGVPDSLPNPNISREKPAPATTRSIPSSMAVFIITAKERAATIMLMPIIPSVRDLAKRISLRNSSTVIPEAAIRPMPPSRATAAANGAVERRIAIPP